MPSDSRGVLLKMDRLVTSRGVERIVHYAGPARDDLKMAFSEVGWSTFRACLVDNVCYPAYLQLREIRHQVVRQLAESFTK